MKLRCPVVAAGALLASLAMCSSASPITPNAGWYGFCFLGINGWPATAGCQGQGIGTAGNSITFTSTGPALFEITDAYQKGDIFDVYIDGLLPFTTPWVPPDTSGAVIDPNVAFADPTYSHASYLLAPGYHQINVDVNYSPYQSGTAYLQVLSDAAPEPATVLFLGSGLLAIILLKRQCLRGA